MYTETRINQNPEYNDDIFSSYGSPSYATNLFPTHCSLRSVNSSPGSTARNSTSSFASVSSSVSHNQEETTACISPVSSLMPETPLNSSSASTMSNTMPNGYESTLQEPSSYTYPPSPTNSSGRVPNSYATDPSSLPTPVTMLNERPSPHTPMRSVSSGGEKLVLTSVDNGAEPLGLSVSPSSSPRSRCSQNVSPRPARSRGSSSSPTALKHVDPIEETITCKPCISAISITIIYFVNFLIICGHNLTGGGFMLA